MAKPSVNFEFHIERDLHIEDRLEARPFIKITNDCEFSVMLRTAICTDDAEEKFIKWAPNALTMNEEELSRLIDMLQISLKLLTENQEPCL